jgi:hypothetical protein
LNMPKKSQRKQRGHWQRYQKMASRNAKKSVTNVGKRE